MARAHTCPQHWLRCLCIGYHFPCICALRGAVKPVPRPCGEVKAFGAPEQFTRTSKLAGTKVQPMLKQTAFVSAGAAREASPAILPEFLRV